MIFGINMSLKISKKRPFDPNSSLGQYLLKSSFRKVAICSLGPTHKSDDQVWDRSGSSHHGPGFTNPDLGAQHQCHDEWR